MDNNNKPNPDKKVGADDSRSAFDEIMDGFYDLSALYSPQQPRQEAPKPKAEPPKPTAQSPKDKEAQRREKAELRRKLEMQAIKEDIERRYSQQLEAAQSNTEPTDGGEKRTHEPVTMSFENERETVREELSRIDEMINSETVAEPVVPPEDEPVRAAHSDDEEQEEQPERKGRSHGSLYEMISELGDFVLTRVGFVLTLIFKVIKYPFAKFAKFFNRVTESTKLRIRKYMAATLDETAFFRREIRSAGKSIRKALRHPLSLPSVLVHYIRKAILRHRELLRTAANIALPAAALVIFVLTINYWNSVTFALEVIYNGQGIGYISDESVYIEATDLVKERLSSDKGLLTDKVNVEATVAAASNLDARYSLALVSLEELNDAQAISDKMIENSVDNLTHACGVYVDGSFICAVKNEADAKTVFYDILSPYEADAKANDYVVGFAESIDYVQGLYRDDKSIMWDAAKLEQTMKSDKITSTAYTASEGDTIDSIAEKFGTTEELLKNANPDYDFGNIADGDSITVTTVSKYVRVKKTVTSSSVRDIEFDTVKQRDATKYSGYRKVLQAGVNGSERVTKTDIYIDGVLYDTDYSYETINEPVDEIIAVGTKTSYGGVYIGSASAKGFLWPAPSCHYVSSPYGWRSSGWHNGMDLTRGGGGALGTPVIASRSGRVEVVQRSNSGYGNMVLINHGDGYKTRYGHMVSGSITVSVGEYVEAGQTIGKVGSTGNSTGPHLHFEVIYNGETQNPRNYIS